MKILRTFDYCDDPPPANLSGVVYMIGFDDWPCWMVIQEVPAVDPDVVFEDKER